MPNLRTTIHVNVEGELLASLREALSACAHANARSFVLVLPPAIRPGREIIEVLVTEGAALAKGTEVVIVHPSPSIGFVVSGAALRLPQVRFVAAASLAEVKGEDPPPGAAESPPDGRDAIVTPADAVSRAFEEARRTRKDHCVIVLDPDKRPSVELVDSIEHHAKRTPGLRTIYLVHPLPVMGFLASTLGLRLPSVTIRAVTSTRLIPAA